MKGHVERHFIVHNEKRMSVRVCINVIEQGAWFLLEKAMIVKIVNDCNYSFYHKIVHSLFCCSMINVQCAIFLFISLFQRLESLYVSEMEKRELDIG